MLTTWINDCETVLGRVLTAVKTPIFMLTNGFCVCQGLKRNNQRMGLKIQKITLN